MNEWVEEGGGHKEINDIADALKHAQHGHTPRARNHSPNTCRRSKVSRTEWKKKVRMPNEMHRIFTRFFFSLIWLLSDRMRACVHFMGLTEPISHPQHKSICVAFDVSFPLISQVFVHLKGEYLRARIQYFIFSFRIFLPVHWFQSQAPIVELIIISNSVWSLYMRYIAWWWLGQSVGSCVQLWQPNALAFVVSHQPIRLVVTSIGIWNIFTRPWFVSCISHLIPFAAASKWMN